MRKKILITGAEGFLGQHLERRLLQSGFEVKAAKLDLLKSETVEAAVALDQWDYIFHFAGISSVTMCEKNPGLAYQVNLAGTALLAEMVRRHTPSSHLIFASTAQVYRGPAGAEKLRFDENREILPQNLYARTKYAAENVLVGIMKTSSLKVSIFRLFNHSHKSQSPDFFLPSLYEKMRSADPAKSFEIAVGNLDISRDIGSIQDLVSAFELFLTLKPSSAMYDTFNLSSGSAKNLRLLAESLADQLGVKAIFRSDPSKVREGEPRFIEGNSEKFRLLTGWSSSCRTEAHLITKFLEEL